jgi:hypothetical protein
LFFIGHVFYALAGYFVYEDILWVFNQNPYATWQSTYGQGDWWHFIRNMPEKTGAVLPFFLAAGLLYGCIKLTGKFIFRRAHVITQEELFLVFGSFVAYFTAHTAFWALGIFNSFGLLRVLIGVMPLMGLICARGILFISLPFERWMHTKAVIWISSCIIFIYPVTNRTFSYKWSRDFSLKADQLAEKEIADHIRQKYPDYENYTFFYEATFPSVALGIDHFDTLKRKPLQKSFEINRFPAGSFVIWDDWYAVHQASVPLEKIENDPRFMQLHVSQQSDYWKNRREARLFRVALTDGNTRYSR